MANWYFKKYEFIFFFPRKLILFNGFPMTDLMGVETDAFGNIFAVSSHDYLNESGKGHKVCCKIDSYLSFFDLTENIFHI